MPDRPSLAAERRTETGKIVKRLRAAGRLPAVVYGHGVPSESLTIDAHTFDALRRHIGQNALVDLKVDGAGDHAGPRAHRPGPPGDRAGRSTSTCSPCA